MIKVQRLHNIENEGNRVKRKAKDQYYLDIADTVLERSTCLRRRYGAIIVSNDEIVSTGYNGAPRGRQNCLDINYCTRETLKIPAGERHELCRAVHAEMNAIISAARRDMIGATLYLSGRDAKSGDIIDAFPCTMCRRNIINSGISRVVCKTGPDDADFATYLTDDWIENDDSLPNIN